VIDLGARADDVVVGHQALDVGFIEARHLHAAGSSGGLLPRPAHTALLDASHQRLERFVALRPRVLQAIQEFLRQCGLAPRVLLERVHQPPFLFLQDRQLKFPPGMCRPDSRIGQFHFVESRSAPSKGATSNLPVGRKSASGTRPAEG
jgi:hypothetical protein